MSRETSAIASSLLGCLLLLGVLAAIGSLGKTMAIILVAVAALLGILLLLSMIGDRRQARNSGKSTAGSNEGPLPYRIPRHFLTPAELSFYHVLRAVVDGRAAICPKVRLSDVLEVANSADWRAYHNRIAQKHLDFLLCAPNTMAPIAGIELDDRSHSRSDRQERDHFFNRAFNDAGLALIRVPVQRQYSAKQLAAQLGPLFADDD